jgi:hypothetical protein
MIRIRSLLAATDFSGDAGIAIRRAALTAAQHRPELALLHVVSNPLSRVLPPLINFSMKARAKLTEEVRRALGEIP